MSNTYVGLVGVNIVHQQLLVQLFQNQGGEINNSPQEYLECGWNLLFLKSKQGRNEMQGMWSK